MFPLLALGYVGSVITRTPIGTASRQNIEFTISSLNSAVGCNGDPIKS